LMILKLAPPHPGSAPRPAPSAWAFTCTRASGAQAVQPHPVIGEGELVPCGRRLALQKRYQ
jgi:hypothetical protein